MWLYDCARRFDTSLQRKRRLSLALQACVAPFRTMVGSGYLLPGSPNGRGAQGPHAIRPSTMAGGAGVFLKLPWPAPPIGAAQPSCMPALIQLVDLAVARHGRL